MVKYELPDAVKKCTLPHKYLQAWQGEFHDEVYFAVGSKREWMLSKSGREYTFTGKTAICHVYSPFDNGVGINHEIAKIACFAYMTGHYRMVEVDLIDRS